MLKQIELQSKKILILENHNELFRLSRLSLWNRWNFFSDFKRVLKGNGFEISTFKKGKVTQFDLEEYDIIVEGLPQIDFTNSEIEVIKDYIMGGGGLLLLAGGITFVKRYNSSYYWYEKGPRVGGIPLWRGVPQWQLARYNKKSISVSIQILNRITTPFNFQFGKRLLYAKNSFCNVAALPRMTKFFPHPLSSRLSDLTIVDAVNVTHCREVNNIQTIGMTTTNTIPSYCVVLIQAQIGDGRVVAMGSPSPFISLRYYYEKKDFKKKPGIPYGLYHPNHLILLLNIMNWLAK